MSDLKMPGRSDPLWTAIFNAIPGTVPDAGEGKMLIFSQRVFIANHVYAALQEPKE